MSAQGGLVSNALRRMSRYKVKSLLMMLGILLSVIATVLIFTIGSAVRVKFTDFIAKSYPSDGIVLAAGNGFMGGGTGRYDLSLDEVSALASDNADIVEWDPILYAGRLDVNAQGANSRVTVMGYSERAEFVRKRSVVSGEFFSSTDVAQRSKVAMVGQNTASLLFPDEDAVGKTLYINGLPFDVIGVLELAGMDPHGGDRDNEIHMPHTTLAERVIKATHISGATYIIDSAQSLDEVANQFREELRSLHSLEDGQQDDFNLTTPTFMLKLVDDAFKTINIFVPIVLGIAFLLSTALILSMMLINVRDRTHEIGLRKAIGATKSSILALIISEVVILALVACAIGVVIAKLAIFLSMGFARDNFGIEAIPVTVTSVLACSLFALLAGLFGAWLPAKRAAQLDPVDALN